MSYLDRFGLEGKVALVSGGGGAIGSAIAGALAAAGAKVAVADVTDERAEAAAEPIRATGAEALTLGNDLLVPGVAEVGPPPVPSGTATVDGYAVTLDAHLHAGAASELTLTVSRDGRPVTDLQPYLGSFGHLVALRAGDLAYLHVHPHESDQAGPDITFTTEVPGAGRYALFLDFRHRGVVRTASFTVEVPR